MLLLDVVHMRLKPGVAIDNRDTQAGLDWHMAMQYVLHTSTVNKAYVSKLSAQRDLWVFLLFDDVEDSRSHFYHQSYGFGIMDQYFEKPPRVYVFSNASVESLETISQWTIHVLRPKRGHIDESELARQETWSKEHLEKILAAEKQSKAYIEQWYWGNDFDEAFVAIVATNHHGGSQDSTSSGLADKHEKCDVELAICRKEDYPDLGSTKAPLSIAELINVRPYEYGLRQEDDFPYADTAYPMGLAHRSMSNMYDPSRNDLSRFGCAVDSPTSPVSSAPEDPIYHKVIVKVNLTKKLAGDEALDGLREVMGLAGEPHGLLELRALNPRDVDAEVSIFSIWESAADLATFKQTLIERDYTASDLVTSCTVTHSWNETCTGLDRVDREWSAGKILELVEFTFPENFGSSEKKSFEGKVYGLWNTMFPAMSHVDDDSVAAPKDPFWTDETDHSTCLLFVAWDGQQQREAWLRNFVSSHFESAGHLAYDLRVDGSHANSTTYDMKTIYTPPLPPYDPGSESDDMGF